MRVDTHKASVVQRPLQAERPTSLNSIPTGCDLWRNELGITVARIHYSADPAKTVEWAEEGRKRAASPAMWNQEMEIQGDAQAGQLVFPSFDRRINVIKPFPIPHDWTRFMGIDPHPRVPHAFLWMAVSPKNDHVYFREYWPSRIYGKRGNVPEDDDRFTIFEYAEAIKMLEGPNVHHFAENGFADNQDKQERIYRRIMDPYGRAVALVRQDGKDEEETFWDRYEKLKILCEPAKKDWDASVDIVNRRLAAQIDTKGEASTPQILIFETLPELILELETNRYQLLTPTQAATRDPTDTPLPKRKHMTDLVRYIEACDPQHVVRRNVASVPPIQEGLSY